MTHVCGESGGIKFNQDAERGGKKEKRERFRYLNRAPE
jgi:hypothetical protein